MASILKKKEAVTRREMCVARGGTAPDTETLTDVEVKVVGMLASESTEGVDGGCDVGLGVNIPSASYVNDLKVAVVHFCLLVLAVLWQK